MPRRKVNENGASGSAGTAAINATNATKPRARRSKKETATNAAVLDANKLEMVSGLYDTQTAPTPQQMQPMQVPQQQPVMHHHHNHNGMLVPMHPDDGSGGAPTAGPPSGTVSAAAAAAHHMYVQSAMPGPMGGPPPEYYHHPHMHPHQGIPPGYHSHHHHHTGAMQPPPGAAQTAGPQGGPQPTAHQFIEPDAPPHSPFVGQPSHMQPPQQPPNHVLIRYNRHGVPPNHQSLSTQLEYRLNEMNRRLFIFSNSGIPEKDHAQWWDAFAHEFFDDEAKMSFVLYDDQNPVHHSRYSIGRMLIPRYYRSIFDSGVKEMFYVIRTPIREQFAGPWSLVLDCDNILLVSKHEKPFSSEVHTECKLICEFVYDENYGYRIRHWNVELRHCQEYILRDANMLQDSETQEKLKMNITRSGLTQTTLNYLKLCAILEPMQILMSRSKSHNITPRETLKQTLFQAHAKYQQMQQQQQQQQHQQHQQMALNAMSGMNAAQHVLSQASVEEPASKKRKRTTRKTAAGGATPAAGSKKKNSSPPAPNSSNFNMNSHIFPVQYQDVMVVGEPSMMGGEYGDEDERTISRVENTQFDPNAMSNQMSMNQPIPATMSLGGPPQVFMNDYELSSIGGWGVGGGNQAPQQSQPPSNCAGTPLGVGTPISSCDQQQA